MASVEQAEETKEGKVVVQIDSGFQAWSQVAGVRSLSAYVE